MHARRKLFIENENVQEIARDIRDKPYTERAGNAYKLIKRCLEVKITTKELAKYSAEYQASISGGKGKR